MSVHSTPGQGSTGTEWAQRPERSNMLLLRLMAWISLRLGRPAGRLVLHLITTYFVLFTPSARRASRAYLGRALGRPARLADGYRHVHCFASTIHDRLYLLKDRFDLFDIRIEGEALIEEVVASGRGALLFGAHLGSFEVIRAVGRHQPDLRIALAMYEDNARRINTLLAAINPAARPEVIALGRLDAMLKVRARLAQGALVGVLADRSLESEDRVSLPLLGSPAALPAGPFRMAAMLEARVVFMAGLYHGGNRYTIRFLPIADFAGVARDGREAAIAAAMRRYADALETCCREAPSNWFNFFDFWGDADR
ncbi:acetyltransferase [Azoarcus olearius]|uniref:LpxL/LpxP family acyltransferase n=1 Tax=Azoarcus sp. (strain BH72) TaxID=418699 RepID=UPI000806265D|nr:acyl-CoA synthetase [Azoarcus olearius]ANQ83348.1 acetyltransferase [Azoarcus olearius]